MSQGTQQRRPPQGAPQGNTQVATRDQNQEKFQGMRALLEKAKPEMAKVMQKEMDPDRMVRFALTAMIKTPKLLLCTRESIGLALMTASSLGIEPNGWDGHLVPYKDVCTFIPDYKGLIKLAYRNPKVLSVQAHAVREKDFFEYEFGSQSHLAHKPAEVDDRGALTHAWALVKMAGEQETFVVSLKSDVLKRMRVSASSSSDSSPWVKWPDEMWAKTAVKALAKFCPLGGDFQRAVKVDSLTEGAIESGDFSLLAAEIDPDNAPLPKTQSDKMADKMAAAKSAPKTQVNTTAKPAADPSPPRTDETPEKEKAPAAGTAVPPEEGSQGEAGGEEPQTAQAPAERKWDTKVKESYRGIDGLPPGFIDQLESCPTIGSAHDRFEEFTGPGSDVTEEERESMLLAVNVRCHNIRVDRAIGAPKA